MPPQARIGDNSLIPADAHGCPSCPHTATGPAVAGSPNVFVNGRPAIRVRDPGIHAACCGPNTWNAKTGSRSVLMNGRPAHRLGDLVTHCGGMGTTIEGSSNVIVGDNSSGYSNKKNKRDKAEKSKVAFSFINSMNDEPIHNLTVTIQNPDGSLHNHSTNRDGKIIIEDAEDGNYQVVDCEDDSLGLVKSTQKELD